jgi:hypothetical protein
MTSTLRVFVSLIVAVAVYYFVFWVPFSLVLKSGELRWVRVVGSLVCAVAVTRYVWRHSASLPRELTNSVIMGALVAGSIGFAGGFFGPMVFNPGGNQGPMLGIFITGPLGVLAGAIGGGIYWLARGSQAKDRV